MSKHDITVTCPACQQPLEADVTIIEDEEGDSGVINGTHRFLTLDDYDIDWSRHHVNIVAAAALDDSIHVPLIPCDKQFDTPVSETNQWGGRYDTWPLMDKLFDCLCEAGIKARHDDDANGGYDD